MVSDHSGANALSPIPAGGERAVREDHAARPRPRSVDYSGHLQNQGPVARAPAAAPDAHRRSFGSGLRRLGSQSSAHRDRQTAQQWLDAVLRPCALVPVHTIADAEPVSSVKRPTPHWLSGHSPRSGVEVSICPGREAQSTHPSFATRSRVKSRPLPAYDAVLSTSAIAPVVFDEYVVQIASDARDAASRGDTDGLPVPSSNRRTPTVPPMSGERVYPARLVTTPGRCAS